MDRMLTFFKESYAELQKVTWLSRKEVIGSTILIIILIVILSIFVSLVDYVFLKFVEILV